MEFQNSLYEPLKITESRREKGVPCGLKNIGNTCFVNSLLQSYFMIPPLVKEIMLGQINNRDSSPSCSFIKNLQILFAKMIGSISKYCDPSDTLNSLVDSAGKKIVFGDQQDIGEFHMLFVENIEKGLRQSKQIEKNILFQSLKEQGKIENLFSGTQIMKISYHVENKKKKFKKAEKFGQILLQLKEGDLISAWEASQINLIEDYIDEENNHRKNVQEETWIETMPEILMFQIGRHFYVQGDPCPYKNNAKFEFPNVLHPERFLYKNKSEIKNLKKIDAEYRNQIKSIKEQIRFLKFPMNEKVSTIDSFNVLINLIASQNVIENSSSKNLLQQLEEWKRIVEEKIAEHERNLEEIQEMLKNLYKKYESSEGYLLHSIMIHDGVAISGHYYAFIRDLDDISKWRKYSDAFVSEVSYEDVIKVSIGGGDSMSSAYCLFYIRTELLENKSDFKRILFLAEDQIQPQDEYSMFISDDLINHINFLNSQENEEREFALIEPTLIDLKNAYTKYLQDIKNMVSFNKNSFNPYFFYHCNNFATFLLVKNKEELGKFYILDVIFSDLFGDSIKNIQNKGLNMRLKEALKNFIEFPKVNLTSIEEREYEDLLKGFQREYSSAELALIILKDINNDKYEESIGAFFIFFQIFNPDSKIYQAISDTYLLYLIFFIRNLYFHGLKNRKLEMVIESCDKIRKLLVIHQDLPQRNLILNSLSLLSQEFKNAFKGYGTHLETCFREISSLVIDFDKLIENLSPDTDLIRKNLDNRIKFYMWKEEVKEGLISKIYHEFLKFNEDATYCNQRTSQILQKLKTGKIIESRDL